MRGFTPMEQQGATGRGDVQVGDRDRTLAGAGTVQLAHADKLRGRSEIIRRRRRIGLLRGKGGDNPMAWAEEIIGTDIIGFHRHVVTRVIHVYQDVMLIQFIDPEATD